MADVIARLKLESGEFDNKIKRATQGILQMERECRKAGGTLAVLEKDQMEYVRSLGNMQTVSQSARGKLNELRQAFTELSVLYKNLRDEERKGDIGKGLSQSLDVLKGRIREAQSQLNATEGEMKGFSGVLSELGAKFGVSSDLMGVLTTGSMGLAAGIGAAATAAVAATKAWADYNAQLEQQDNITTVTTGLKGADAGQMTDAARSISEVYGTDFREVINAANTLMAQFGETGDSAIQLIRDGMQGMLMGDGPKLLSMIQQFAPSFRDAGISASQLVAIIQNSEGGIFTDQNMNAIVMGIKNIRLMTTATSDALKMVGIDGEEMTRKLNDGSMTIFQALGQVSNAIQAVGTGSQAAGSVMQQVFGRQGAAAGTNLGKAIATLNTNLEETKNQTGEVGQSFAQLERAQFQLNAAMRETFATNGWTEMSNNIKTSLLTELANVVKGIQAVGEAIGKVAPYFIGTLVSLSPAIVTVSHQIDQIGFSSQTAFSLLEASVSIALGPLGTMLELLRNIGIAQQNVVKNAPPGATLGGHGIFSRVTGTIRGQMEGIRQQGYRMQFSPSSAPTVAAPKAAPKSSPRVTARHTKLTPEQQVAANVQKAEGSYDDAIDSAARRLAAGLINADEYTKKMEQAQQTLIDAYDKAYQATGDQKYLDGFTETAEANKHLKDIIKENADYLEQAKKAPAMSLQGISDWKKDATSRQQVAEIGSPEYESIAENIKDVDAITVAIQEAVKAGLDPSELGLSEMLTDAMSGVDISDDTLQGVVDKINEVFEGTNFQLKFDVETGGIKKVTKEVSGLAKTAGIVGDVAGSIGQAFNAIEDPAAKVMGTVAQAIATVALGYAQAQSKASDLGPWGWVAFAATGLATMLNMVSTIHSATGYAQGGIVDGRGGGFVGGSAYSGDNIGNVRLDAGELVLNRSQQTALADQLDGNPMRNLNLSTRISGRFLEIAINNDSRSRSRGKLVTTNNRG